MYRRTSSSRSTGRRYSRHSFDTALYRSTLELFEWPRNAFCPHRNTDVSRAAAAPSPWHECSGRLRCWVQSQARKCSSSPCPALPSWRSSRKICDICPCGVPPIRDPFRDIAIECLLNRLMTQARILPGIVLLWRNLFVEFVGPGLTCRSCGFARCIRWNTRLEV